MHVLAVNSVSTLLNYLDEQLQKTPTEEEIQKWSEVLHSTLLVVQNWCTLKKLLFLKRFNGLIIGGMTSNVKYMERKRDLICLKHFEKTIYWP